MAEKRSKTVKCGWVTDDGGGNMSSIRTQSAIAPHLLSCCVPAACQLGALICYLFEVKLPSLFEPWKMSCIKQLDIRLNKDYFYPGELIEGKLVIEVAEPLHLNGNDSIVGEKRN